MKTKHIAILSALLLANVAGGMAFAESQAQQQGGTDTVPQQTASQSYRQSHGEDEGFLSSLFRKFGHHGEHHGNHSDDDDDDEGGAGLTQNGPTNPNAPVPDSGVFNNQNRPKVQVQ